jgi:hypothetical protein
MTPQRWPFAKHSVLAATVADQLGNTYGVAMDVFDEAYCVSQLGGVDELANLRADRIPEPDPTPPDRRKLEYSDWKDATAKHASRLNAIKLIKGILIAAAKHDILLMSDMDPTHGSCLAVSLHLMIQRLDEKYGVPTGKEQFDIKKKLRVKCSSSDNLRDVVSTHLKAHNDAADIGVSFSDAEKIGYLTEAIEPLCECQSKLDTLVTAWQVSSTSAPTFVSLQVLLLSAEEHCKFKQQPTLLTAAAADAKTDNTYTCGKNAKGIASKPGAGGKHAGGTGEPKQWCATVRSSALTYVRTHRFHPADRLFLLSRHLQIVVIPSSRYS